MTPVPLAPSGRYPLLGRTGRTAARGEATLFLTRMLAIDPASRPLTVCLAWPYGTTYEGYGQVKWPTGQRRVAHIICEAARGPRPSRHHQVRHICGCRVCINPTHLTWSLPPHPQI